MADIYYVDFETRSLESVILESDQSVHRAKDEECPACGAKPDQWCDPFCIAIDEGDYR